MTTSTTIELDKKQMNFFKNNDLTKAEVMRSITDQLILAEHNNGKSTGFIGENYKITIEKIGEEDAR